MRQRGGAFVLFTSHRALCPGGGAAACALGGASRTYRLFVQGEAPRERLLQEFRADGNGVLLGTASFWEGVDVKGEALRLVVIEKLPVRLARGSAGARAHRAPAR